MSWKSALVIVASVVGIAALAYQAYCTFKSGQ